MLHIRYSNIERCAILHTGMKCETVNENHSRVIGIFDRTGVGVVEEGVSYMLSGHYDSGKV